eukprot:TRINITY_DN2572_c0_g1_i1.p1 TRINITY_DN2572_c0_g1~~TRINITY_DN2572_c0_g1_i1.p1  ORF type:complete len:511 (+),score=90.12 TRINITY_DN2572_c0_g1_i1:237-1769(+)
MEPATNGHAKRKREGDVDATKPSSTLVKAEPFTEVKKKRRIVRSEPDEVDDEAILDFVENEIGAAAERVVLPSKTSRPSSRSNGRDLSEDGLTNLVFNVIVPMYGLIHSIKDLLPARKDLAAIADQITTKEELSGLVDQVKGAPPGSSRGGSKRRQPGGVVKPRTAFHFWSAEVRPTLTHLQFSEVPTELGRLWKTVPGEVRAKYQDLADKDKERYYDEAGPDAGIRAPPSKRRSSSGGSSEPADHGPIIIRSKRTSAEVMRKLKELDNAVIIDVSNKSTDTRWGKFCMGYPHGGIPVPFDKSFAMSAEGIFEGLKVFEGHDVDKTTLMNRSMKGIQRLERRNGRLLGWRRGLVPSAPMLNSKEARFQILLPTYYYILSNLLKTEVAALRSMLAEGTRLVFLDTVTASRIHDYDKPLSTAYLIKRFLENKWPTIEEATTLEREQPIPSASSPTVGKPSPKSTKASTPQVTHREEEEDEDSSDSHSLFVSEESESDAESEISTGSELESED